MAGPALDYSYHYLFESAITAAGKKSTQPALRLATFTEEEVNPYFFEGRLRQPYKVGSLLQGLVQLVRTRFFVHQAMLPQVADPIITAHEDPNPPNWSSFDTSPDYRFHRLREFLDMPQRSVERLWTYAKVSFKDELREDCRTSNS